MLASFVLAASASYVLVRTASAQISVGASSADFLSFEIGGRPAGMAGAQTGLAGGVTAQFWNPAALAGLDRSQVGAMHASWLQDLNYEWIGLARPVGPGVGALSVSYFHTPAIQGVDEFDNPIGEFKVYDLAVSAGFARAFGRGFSVGANVKMIRQSLGEVAATGPAADFGAQASIAGTTVGAVVQNLGPGLSFDGASYPLPRQIRAGIARAFLSERLLVAADYNIPRDYHEDVRIGTELRAHPNVALRLGYRHEIGASDDPATGLSYGLGLRFHQLEVDYALTPDDQFDDVHRLSFGYSFGSGPDEPKPRKPERAPKPAPPATTSAPIASSERAGAKSVTPAPKPAVPPAAPQQPAPSVDTERTLASTKPIFTEEEMRPRPTGPQEFAVVLPGYSTKESAQAELKALELLGFRVKDAVIERAANGYQIRLVRMKSKSKADETASSLARMSFRAVVELVQR